MKKTLLLFVVAGITFTANAQLTLTGTSYTQNFNGLPTYPTGWSTYNAATSTSLGNIEAIQYFGQSFPSVMRPDTSCIATVYVGGFKDFPSANVCHEGDDYCATTPPSYSDRALGVRQVSPTNATHPNLDPGASFVLKLANTTGLKTFALSFKLQSFDTSSPRVTTWTVDYGIGATPTSFIPVTTTGVMTTGGNTFSNNTVTASFGTALNNISTPVYIRISALSASAGSGNRPSSAIDDFTLTYLATTSVSTVSAQPELSLSVLGTATSDKLNLSYDAEEAGNYMLSIYDLAGRMMHNETIAAHTGAQTVSIDGLHLAPGMYIAKMNNGNSSSVARIVVQ
jgi:hypothetical protein